MGNKILNIQTPSRFNKFENIVGRIVTLTIDIDENWSQLLKSSRFQKEEFFVAVKPENSTPISDPYIYLDTRVVLNRRANAMETRIIG